jgi:acetyl-CoA acetyltransferase
MCRYCRARALDTRAVSGGGTVLAVTVNHQQWLPAFPPPYAIAIVGIDDDPRVRLTSNIIGCAPEDVRIGMKVTATFERCEDVWVPVFTPSDAPDETPASDPAPARVRAMVSPEKFEDRVAITGIGQSDIGRRLMRPPLSLTVDACLQAIDDSGLQLEDIDGLATYPGPAPGSGMSEGGVTPLEEALGVHPTWICGSSDTPGPSGAVVNAMLAVASGLCRHVLCFRTVWETTASALRGAGGSGGAKRLTGEVVWRHPYGAISPANWIGMLAARYLHEFGATREMLGHIAVNARRNAGLNPAAVYREPMTMDDYLDARMISTPFGLYDCDVPCDGAVAIIVSSVDAARDLRRSPVYVEAVGTQVRERISWDQGGLTHEPQVLGPAQHLWSRTDVQPADVDVAEIYDGFTFNCISWLEALGFCGIGEASEFVGDSSRLALTGELPLNTHGGQLSGGRTHGFGFIHEAVVQLRGAAGARQVDNARLAVVATGGGTPGGCMLLRSDP